LINNKQFYYTTGSCTPPPPRMAYARRWISLQNVRNGFLLRDNAPRSLYNAESMLHTIVMAGSQCLVTHQIVIVWSCCPRIRGGSRFSPFRTNRRSLRTNYRVNMALYLRSLFWLHVHCAQLYSWAAAPQPSPPPPYTPAFGLIYEPK
jgi:hypothetical protein